MKIDVDKMCALCCQFGILFGTYHCRRKPENIAICIRHLTKEEKRLFRKATLIDNRVGWFNFRLGIFGK